MACWPKDVWSRLSNTEDQAFLSSMQNDRTASIAGKDIKTHKLEIRQLEQAEKNEEATVAMLANSSDDQFSSQSPAPEDADDCNEKIFCFWFGRILLF